MNDIYELRINYEINELILAVCKQFQLFLGYNGIRVHDFRDTNVMLYQLSYESGWRNLYMKDIYELRINDE